jgi:hypothetical protein
MARNFYPIMLKYILQRGDAKMLNQTVFPVINLIQTGRNIESHRKNAGLSVRDLQKIFGFEYPQAIYKWQHGECLPTVDNLLVLSRIFNVKIDDLLICDDCGDQEVSVGDSCSAA